MSFVCITGSDVGDYAMLSAYYHCLTRPTDHVATASERLLHESNLVFWKDTYETTNMTGK